MDVFSPVTEEDAIKFLQEKRVLPKERKCPNSPDHNMKLVSMGKREFLWRCSRRSCGGKRMSIKSGTWFSNSTIPLVQALRFFYCWTLNLTSVTWCKDQLGMHRTTSIAWNSSVREAIAQELIRRPSRKIGGHDRIVEVDETLFSKRKNNAGRVLPPQWIVGGVCRETKQCFLKAVPDRSATTLLAVIRENIAEGSNIYSDCWKGYKTSELEAAGFQHITVNHRYHFVDPLTGAHTQTIERIWGSLKWRNRQRRGTLHHLVESYLTEFIWRQQIGDNDPFYALLQAIKNYTNEESADRALDGDGDGHRCQAQHPAVEESQRVH